MFLCSAVRKTFMSEPMLLELEAPIKIAGDIHGNFDDLLRIFQRSGYPGDENYLFLGDYVDRGTKSIECISLLFAYKLKYPSSFFILRGNHESSLINQFYGFYEECERKYDKSLW